MARIYPFRALRYDTAKVRMEEVVTQPYDKITPAMQDKYYARSPFNLVRVVLGKREPGDTDAFSPLPIESAAHNVYTRAADSLNQWRKAGVLREEAEPALYGYSQTYQVPGSEEVRERRGFIALGQLYDYAEHIVYRHEQTFPKHKSDRLALFKATRAYCEQIYMLYSDPAFTAEELIFGGSQGEATTAADLEIVDDDGVVHRVWKLTDPRLINLIVTAMADKKLIIADGHHRYETSVTYSKERAEALGIAWQGSTGALRTDAGDTASLADDEEESPSNRADEPHSLLPRPPFPEAAMMMTFVNMEAPGITILPTHRVLFGISPPYAELVQRASPYFTIQPHTGGTGLDGSTPVVSFLVVHGRETDLWTAKPDAVRARLRELQPGLSSRQLELDVVQLHRLVLEDLLGLTHESIANLENIRYLRDGSEAEQQVRSGEADLAFLIRPVTLDQLRSISLSGDVMPQKSTDFYPKLLSGLAIYALD